MKKAFTLIELLITLAIITMVTVLGVPAFAKYGERSRFDQKISEIKFAMDEVHLRMLNPENGASTYGLKIADSDGVRRLSMTKNGDEYRRITISAKDSISTGTDLSEMKCVVSTKICGKDSDTDVTIVPEYQYLFFSNSDIGRTVSFSIKHNPFGVIVTDVTPL